MTATPNLVPFSAYFELRQLLPSQIQVLSPCIDQIMNFIAKLRNVDGSEVDIELALREALANAIAHGNGEDSRIRVTCRCTTNGEVSITVQDEGQGFESETVPDPTAPENRLRISGRGIYLIKTLMDEFHFEHRGTVVHMRKKSKARSGVQGETRWDGS